nr:MAG TPA: hypothetical protein [Caudoviricetes sp.]
MTFGTSLSSIGTKIVAITVKLTFLHPQKLPLIMLRSFLMNSAPAMKQTTMKLKKHLVVVVAGVWKPIQRSRPLILTVRMLSLASSTKSGK